MSLPTVQFSSESEQSKSQVLSLGFVSIEIEKSDKKGPQTHKTKEFISAYKGKKNKDFESFLGGLRDSKHFLGKKSETSVLRFFNCAGYQNVVLIGLGTPKDFCSESARQVGATLYHLQKREKFETLAFQLDSLLGPARPSMAVDIVQGFVEGYLLASYEFKEHKKPDPHSFSPKSLMLLGAKNISFVKAAEKAGHLVAAVHFARAFGDEPANKLTPTEFAKRLEKMSKESGLKCTVLGRKEMEKEKMGLLLGVSVGSTEEPKLIIMEHLKGKKSENPIVLVGKGITFDTGGISLKPSNAMEDMKYDMMGAATVAGIMKAVASLKINRNIVGIIASSENMPGGRAQKPGDVQASMSGKTVEITNTDAEGRLVLADALEYAQKHHAPQAMIDYATLTGAVIVALGTFTTGIMGTSKSLLEQIKRASDLTGEKVWELPLMEEYEEDMKTPFADIRNSGNREAGSSKGGIFLKHFVEPQVPWVHCDIAGSSYHRKDKPYFNGKYAAGTMIRLTLRLLENWKTPK